MMSNVASIIERAAPLILPPASTGAEGEAASR
jgi:hypothetical protein